VCRFSYFAAPLIYRQKSKLALTRFKQLISDDAMLAKSRKSAKHLLTKQMMQIVRLSRNFSCAN
jgi:hypothetical protein